MRGVVFLGERKVELRSFPDPTPGPGEVVLEMKASGMCGSDLKFYRSPPGAATSTVSPLVLPIRARAMGEDSEMRPCLAFDSRSPTI